MRWFMTNSPKTVSSGRVPFCLDRPAVFGPPGDAGYMSEETSRTLRRGLSTQCDTGHTQDAFLTTGAENLTRKRSEVPPEGFASKRRPRM
jgi:hypothetical protein